MEIKVFSLISALKYLGFKYKTIINPEDLKKSFDMVILPGVGAFGDAMFELSKKIL